MVSLPLGLLICFLAGVMAGWVFSIMGKGI
jgi:hypothetical protein